MSKIRFVTRRVCELYNKHTFVTSLGLCTATFQRQLRMLSWFLTMCCNLLSFCYPMKKHLQVLYQFVTLPISETLWTWHKIPMMKSIKPWTRFFLVPGDATTSCMELAYDTIIGRWQETTFPVMEKGNWLAPVGASFFSSIFYHEGEPTTTCLHFWGVCKSYNPLF